MRKLDPCVEGQALGADSSDPRAPRPLPSCHSRIRARRAARCSSSTAVPPLLSPKDARPVVDRRHRHIPLHAAIHTLRPPGRTARRWSAPGP
uniref:Uncharacterized protein n=1 Tax=Arundo donax TaxID=35708 RepID=A0A0A9HQ74_ARUDO